MNFNLQTPQSGKLIRSALISGGGVLFVLLLKYLFPGEYSALEAAVLGAVGAWFVNLIKEGTGN